MKDTMGIIYTTKDDLSLRELTSQRAIAALPVAGRYRIVDFLLSCMVNSDVRNVGVITQKNYHSLMDHLGAGKEWDLHTRNNGLFILPPLMTRDNAGEYTGVLDALRSNFDYVRRSKQEYVILTSSHTVYNTSFEPMIRQHMDSGADITLMYAKFNPAKADFGWVHKNDHAFLRVEDDRLVTDMEINPNAASYDNLYMDVLIMKRTLMIHLVDMAIAHGERDLNKDVLQTHILSQSLKVCGWEYQGYYKRIETIMGYFNFNLDLLKGSVRSELFSVNPVYTKTRDDVPALYMEGSCVRNSLVADGCVIQGTVENCVLFRGVRVDRGAVVRNAVILQDSHIEDCVELENVILDKYVTIRSHGRLIGQRQYPIVIAKNATL